MTRYYDWKPTFSRQTGSNGEFCMVVGGKDIGKTFGLRFENIRAFINKGLRYVELARTKDSRDYLSQGYFDKLIEKKMFPGYLFKTEGKCGYIAKQSDEPEWQLMTYFVALTDFQKEKTRTYSNLQVAVFDEFIIDTKDKYHHYLTAEPLILANLLDSIFREDPNESPKFKCYLLGNSCDLTNPYFQFFKIDRIPEYGYTWFNDKHVLLHYVEPWDADERMTNTFVGRMLAGHDEGKMIFQNRFETAEDREIARKPSSAKYAYGLVFMKARFGIWIDYDNGIWYVNQQIPKNAKAVYTLTKRDNRIDYQAVNRSSDMMQLLVKVFYLGALRYSTYAVRESFFQVLSFLGIK